MRGVRGLSPLRFAAVALGGVGALAASSVIALALGPSGLGPSDTLAALFGHARDAAAADIVLRIRLPRVALAAVVGAALATSGALFQALLRNPLADPFVLGISGGAALGGILVLGLGGAVGLAVTAVPAASFAGALGSLILLFAVAGGRGRLSSTSLLLTGVVFNAFASAAIVTVASVAGLAEGASIFLWLIGSLSSARASLVGLVGGLVGFAIVFTLPLARQLDLLALGEETAAQLGVEVERVRRWLLVASSLMVGAAVAVSGLIGFVGLIIPHAIRLAIGPDHRLLLPSSALVGAAFLVLCDTAARTLLPGRELPVGAVTALAGGPLFLVLLRRQQSQPLLP